MRNPWAPGPLQNNDGEGRLWSLRSASLSHLAVVIAILSLPCLC